jgi:hypothetical protein
LFRNSSRASARIVLIRHAQSAPSRDAAEPGGSRKSETNGHLGISRNQGCCQRPLQARDGDRPPFAEAFSLPMHVEPDLRERLLAPLWIRNLEALTDDIKWRAVPVTAGRGKRPRSTDALRGCRSSRVAARRPGGSIGVATHGAVIAHLMRHHLDDLPGDHHERIGARTCSSSTGVSAFPGSMR